MDVQIGFSSTSKTLSWLIRAITGKPCSHTFILFECEDFKTPMVLEHSLGYGLDLLTLEDFLRENTILQLIKVDWDLSSAVRTQLERLGEPYNFSGLLGMLVVLAGRRLQLPWRNPFRRADRRLCTEVVVHVLQEAGFPGAHALRAEDLGPEDVRQFLLSSAR